MSNLLIDRRRMMACGDAILTGLHLDALSTRLYPLFSLSNRISYGDTIYMKFAITEIANGGISGFFAGQGDFAKGTRIRTEAGSNFSSFRMDAYYCVGSNPYTHYAAVPLVQNSPVEIIVSDSTSTFNGSSLYVSRGSSQPNNGRTYISAQGVKIIFNEFYAVGTNQKKKFHLVPIKSRNEKYYIKDLISGEKIDVTDYVILNNN